MLARHPNLAPSPPRTRCPRYFDALIAVVVSVCLGLYGCYTLRKNARVQSQPRWWTGQFWTEAPVGQKSRGPGMKGSRQQMASELDMGPIGEIPVVVEVGRA